MTPEGRLGVLVGDRINITCNATDCGSDVLFGIYLKNDTTENYVCDTIQTADKFLNCPIQKISFQQNGSQHQCYGVFRNGHKPFDSLLVLLVQGCNYYYYYCYYYYYYMYRFT